MEYKPITIETCYKNRERLFKEDHEICNKMKASTHSSKDMRKMDKRRFEIFCLIGIYDRDINRLSKECK
jgi:hypothetical protein